MVKESRYWTGWTGALALVVALAWAAPSEAARVLDLRVGRHADFTRIVFELDAPAGYKIERHEPAPGIAELMISLEAGGTPIEVKGAKRRIDSVSLESAGPGRSLVRIRLSRDGLRLKEMILAGPPRIVLDIMGGEPETRTAAAPASEPEPTPEPSAAAPEPVAEPVVEEVPEPPAPARVDAVVEAGPPSGSVEETLDASQILDAAGMGSEPSVDAAAEVAEVEGDVASAEPSEGAFDEFGIADEAPVEDAAPADRMADPTPMPSRTPPPFLDRETPAESDSLFSTQNLVIAGVGLLLLGGGIVFMSRRSAARSASESEPEGENPFSSFGEAPAGESGEAVDAAALFAEESGSTEVGSDLFDAAPEEGEKKEDEMEATSSTYETDAADAAVGEDVMRLIRELERRVTSLESRLDETVDTKERLERQVAAQTEELRVQRAAIARTQRAVRNLNRPEDDGATEPAEREA